VLQPPVNLSANRRASVRGNHRPPLATPRRDHFSARAPLPKDHGRLDVDFSPTLPGSLTILNGIAIRQLR